jgi:hypothetical protein
MATTETRIDKNLSKLEAQLELWSAKLTEVAGRARVAGEQAKVDSRKQLDELKSRLEVARSKLDEARAAGAEKWEIFKDGIEHIWGEIEGTFKKLVH